MEDKIIEVVFELQRKDITGTEAINRLLALYNYGGLRPFPADYDEVKATYLEYLEKAFLKDLNLESIDEVVYKTDFATDEFAKYLLRN